MTNSCIGDDHVFIGGGAVVEWAMTQLGIPDAPVASDVDVFLLSNQSIDQVPAFLEESARGSQWVSCSLRRGGIVDVKRQQPLKPWQFIYSRLGCTSDSLTAMFDLDYVCTGLRCVQGELYLGLG
jgi:hypothetical protein